MPRVIKANTVRDTYNYEKCYNGKNLIESEKARKKSGVLF